MLRVAIPKLVLRHVATWMRELECTVVHILLAAGLAFPAAQPQTELITTKAVPS